MSLGRLRWTTILLPIAFIVAVQACVMFLLEPLVGSPAAHWVALPVVVLAVVVFSSAVFRALDRMQRRIVRQNEELSALNAVGRALGGSPELPEALNAALRSVIAVTHAGAAEVRVDGDDERPLTFSQGEPAALECLRRLPEEVSGLAAGEASVSDLHLSAHPAAVQALDQGLRAYARVPLTARNRQFGTMTLLAADGYLTSEGSERLLAALGSQIAAAVQASQLFENVLRRGQEAHALYEIGLKIASLQDLQQILRSIVEQARQTLGADTAALCLASGQEGLLTLADWAGPSEAFPGQLPTGAPVAPTLGAPSEQAGGAPSHAPCPPVTAADSASRLAAPLRVGESSIGELCVYSAAPRRFGERHRDLLAGLADMAAIAINNARLLERERYVAVLEERERLAREMHDSLAQVLGYLHLKAEGARLTIARRSWAKAERELEDMASLAHEAFLDVREAILGLSETISSPVGIVGTLEDYLEKFRRQSGIAVDLELLGDGKPHFSPHVEVQLVRVVQEALTNVRKHAGAERAWVCIDSSDRETSITVADNGQGFDLRGLDDVDHRFGLRTMRERVERVGGRFAIESSPGQGTKVRVCFPRMEGRL
ncbi:MAG TPA: GAF domain-containing protein [Dehalococcoidia bacterium]|nr:GAF domain-containing protein [Dehalococcoidia bacterium]